MTFVVLNSEHEIYYCINKLVLTQYEYYIIGSYTTALVIYTILYYNAFIFRLDDTPSCQPEVANHSFSAESHLINCMLERYARVSTHVRPVRDSSNSVVVFFGISLIQILDFDEIKQVLTTSMWKNYVSQSVRQKYCN